MIRTPQRLGVSVAALVLLPGLSFAASGPPRSADGSADPSTPTTTSATQTHRITLVTGDMVLLAGGNVRTGQLSIEPTKPGESFVVQRLGSDVYVFPTSAAVLIADGALDQELFNISTLSQLPDGKIPVIVQDEPGARIFSGQQQMPAQKGPRLESIKATAWTVPAGKAHGFWKHVTNPAPEAGEVRLAPSVGKVWLDAPVNATDITSTEQIGAPAAWAAGFTGDGQKIAVLDTGIDPTHPDFEGRVLELENFTPDPDAMDHHGHGTHVAGIAAGSGPHPGVAPEADLLVGKVLANDGRGATSWIIDGMEWATAQGADVVNMSLGGNLPSDGTDPLSQAVNQLSSDTGTLFVVAAGNEGPDETTVSAPAAAELALSVGNVTATDAVSRSSSRGPRLLDGAIKPEITAPGTGITAARATGTSLGSPVDDLYTRASGTSMAAPHVAGAAALLHQAHSDWDAQTLKAALASTAEVIPGWTVYDQGSGRIDAARAIAQPVFATSATLFFGKLEWPNHDTPPVPKPLTYRNESDVSVTLELTAEIADETGAPVPGLVTLDQTSLTIPSGGEASVTATFDSPAAATGHYSGYVTATDATRDVVVSTAMGVTKEDELYTLRVSVLDRHGNPTTGQFSLFDVNDSDNGFRDLTISPNPENGQILMEVPAGTYSLMGTVRTADAKVDRADVALVGDPELEVNGNVSITLDARQAATFAVDTGEDTHERGATLTYHREPAAGRALTSTYLNMHVVPNTRSALPTDPVTIGKFEFDTSVDMVAEDIRLTLDGNKLPLEYALGSPVLDGRHTLRLVDGGSGSDAELAGVDLRHAAVYVALPVHDVVPILDDLGSRLASRGAVAVLASVSPNGYPTARADESPIPVMLMADENATALEQALTGSRPTRVELTGEAQSPFRYSLRFWEIGRIPESLTYSVSDDDLAAVTADYHSDTATTGLEYLGSLRPYEKGAAITVGHPLPLPTSRIEYRTADPGLTWSQRVVGHTPRDLDVTNLPRILSPGQQITESWQAQPLHPAPQELTPEMVAAGQTTYCPNCRNENGIFLTWGDLGDAEKTHSGRSTGADGQRSTLTLMRDGAVLGVGKGIRSGLPIPSGVGDYTLVHEYSADVPWRRYSVPQRTEWEFSSSWTGPTELPDGYECGKLGSECAPLPLMRVEYDVPVALDNTITAPSTIEFGVLPAHLAHFDLPELSEVSILVSFDSGITWRPVDATVDDHGWYRTQVQVPSLPQTSGTMSLRVRAVDSEGNTVDQTLTDAVGLRRPGRVIPGTEG